VEKKGEQEAKMEAYLQRKAQEVQLDLESRRGADLHLVPDVLFHENPRHSEILQGNNRNKNLLFLFY
jgi:hypothetical protein